VVRRVPDADVEEKDLPDVSQDKSKAGTFVCFVFARVCLRVFALVHAVPVYRWCVRVRVCVVL
jgi:hypothetical protein